MPLNTDVIEQIVHELWITGRAIIAEIDRLATRIQELIRQDDQPRQRKSKRARRAAKVRKPKSR